MPVTIKSKFILFSVIFTLMVFGIPFAFLVKQLNENFHQRSLILLDTTIDMLRYGLNNAMMIGEQKNVQHIVDKIALNRNIEHLRLLDLNGQIKYSSIPDEMGKSIFIVSPDHIEKGFKERKIRKVKFLSGDASYSISEPILNTTECQTCHTNGAILAYIDVDTRFTRAETSFFTGVFHLLFLSVAFIIAFFLAFYMLFNYYINTPLVEVMRAVSNFEKGKLDFRLKTVRKDEMGILQRHVNKMAEEIKKTREEIENLHLEQLQRADKLVNLGELSAEVAHEVNNHSAVIMSRADYILLEASSNPALLRFQDDLDVIIKEITKVSQITGNILRNSKKLPRNFGKMDLAKIVSDGLKIYEPVLRKKSCTLIEEYPDEPVYINGDPVQIEQILSNLVTNAIDASQNEIEIRIAVQKLGADEVRLSVSDKGEGMSAEKVEHIFSPFFTTKPPGKGTGLGLYIVQKICKNHRATLDCQSEPGEGTTFNITFKILKEDQ